MGKKKQLFWGFTVKRAISHWVTKILGVHPRISEIDSIVAFQLLHTQAMLIPSVSGAYPALQSTYQGNNHTTYYLVLPDLRSLRVCPHY